MELKITQHQGSMEEKHSIFQLRNQELIEYLPPPPDHLLRIKKRCGNYLA